MSRVVAFDLGGVLVDVVKDHLDVFAGDAFFGDRHDVFSRGGIDEDAWVAAVAHDIGSSSGSGIASSKNGNDVDNSDHVRAAWEQVVSWSSGGLALLRTTAALGPVRLWSNTDPIHWRVLQHGLRSFSGSGISGDFDDVATLSFRCGFMKPDPRFYAAALGNDDPGDVLFLDDRAENVAAAIAMGVNAVVVHGVDEAAVAIAGWRDGAGRRR